MKINELEIDSINEYENNPRINENAVDYVANSIKEFGFKVPIIIDQNNVIVAGHTRLRAAEQIGLKKVPCIIADDLTPEQIKAFRLADNKTSELSSWDEDKLYIELMELEKVDFKTEQFGFETREINSTESSENDNFNPDSTFNYEEQYGVIVICKNETEQENIYNQLVEEGFECKVVAT